MTVRLKDIAFDLGLSVVTISKVLRDHPDIAEETRQRVLKRVQEVDYQPNITARSLVTGRSYLIGLVVPDLLHPFYAELAKALSAAVSGLGYSTIISSSEEDPELEAREIQHLTGRRLDALVVASSGTDIKPFQRLERHGVPYVLIDRELQGLSTNFVGTNDESAGYLATEHLIEQGCKVIAHIRGREISPGVKRFAGYRRALQTKEIPFSDSLVIRPSTVDVNTEKQGAEAMRLLLKRRPMPDGVFVFNDPLAIGVVHEILKSGLRIPEDVAVVGCGNLLYDHVLRVPLSSVDQKSQVIGERTAEILIGILESKERAQPRCIIIEPTLEIRASSLKIGPVASSRSIASARAKNAHAPKARAEKARDGKVRPVRERTSGKRTR